jgi:DNA-binding PadR family transcriptional regulator
MLTDSAGQVNIGQVYTTLGRLERDRLVSNSGEDHEGRVYYEITAPGIEELSAWFDLTIMARDWKRDNLATKFAFAVLVGADVAELVHRQVHYTQNELLQLTQRRREARARHLAPLLVLESRILHAEADLRWLERVDEVIRDSSATEDSPLAS